MRVQISPSSCQARKTVAIPETYGRKNGVFVAFTQLNLRLRERYWELPYLDLTLSRTTQSYRVHKLNVYLHISHK